MVVEKEALVAMRFFLFCFSVIALANLVAEEAEFNTTKNRRVMVVAGAGGEEEYKSLFAEWANTLALSLIHI